MKNIQFLLYGLLFLGFMGISCTELETELNSEWSDKDVWQNANTGNGGAVGGILQSVYKDIFVTADSYDGNFLDAATDNALTRNYGSSVYRASQGAFSYTSNPLDNWSSIYKQLQLIHIFMEKGLSDDVCYDITSPDVDAKIKQRYLGEAYFLRAWCSFQLLQMYGGKVEDGSVLGYTIVTDYITPEESDNPENFKRDSYEACVEQICADCDKAFDLLPLRYTASDPIIGSIASGRASGLAAAALKVRVLTYAASPAYQPDNIVKLNDMGYFTVVDEVAYKAKWKRAALYAAEVLKLETMGEYKALEANMLYAGSDDYDEFIFRAYNGNICSMEERHYPPFYYGNAQTIPSHNLAAAFPAKNGFPISDTRSGYDADNPYICERDNRFNINLYYHGRKFGNNNSYIDVTPGGKDSGYFDVKASRSGYYLGKFINTEAVDMLKPYETKNSQHYNPLLRRGEVWLNFAEASFEAWGIKTVGEGCPYSAYDVIRTIREKSGGISDVTYLDEMAQSEADFRKVIQNERRLELAFENHRFWDLRRWLLPLNETVLGMEVTRTTDGIESFAVKALEERPMNDIRYYYLPLPYNELKKNPNLKNNMGWN